jgi:two-component system, LytTR family, response regulator
VGRRACKIFPYTIFISDPTESRAAPGYCSAIYFPINYKNITPLLVAIQEESVGLPTPAVESEESEAGVLHSNDSVLLADGIKCWIVRIEDISLLEACFNCTLVHFFDDRLLIRRTLGDCERRLDNSTFFRASRGCIVNLSHVKQSRLLEDERLSFLLNDGKEVVFSRRQSVHFRKTRGL